MRPTEEELLWTRGNKASGIYFVLMHAPGIFPIKIGKTTSVQARMSEYKTSCPFQCSIIGFIFKDPKDLEQAEAALHEKYADRRLAGEWFLPSIAMIDHMKAECGWTTSRLGEIAARVQSDPSWFKVGFRESMFTKIPLSPQNIKKVHVYAYDI